MDVIEIIYLVAIAFAFASVLVIQFRIETDRKLLLSYLSAYLFILGISNLMLLFVMTGWMIHFPYLYKVFMPLSLLSPVLAYWYVKGNLGEPYVPRRWEYLHLAPFILVSLHYLPFIAASIEEKETVVRAVIENNEVIINYSYGWIFTEAQIFILRTVQAVVYLWLSWRIIKRFTKKEETANRRSQIVINWLKFFVKAMSTYLTAIILCYVLFGLRYNGIQLEEIIERIVFIFTASLGLTLSAYLLLHPKAVLSIDRPVEVLDQNSPLNFADLKARIQEMGWHRDIELTASKLLDHLEISKIDFTHTIKLEGVLNFSDFINSIRLECFLNEANEEELKKSSLEGVARKCGFKSSATFYRVFKEKYGTTPKRYLDELKSVEA